VINGIALFEDIEIYEGNYVVDTFTVSADIANQRFILSNPNVDTSIISVSVRNNQTSTVSRKFVQSNNLFSVSSSSRIFFVQEVEDERYELIFGDGIFGEKLENSNYIEVSCIITNAESANGVSSFTFNGRILDNSGLSVTSGISLITTNTASSGGQEIESVNSIKKYASRFYASQNRAVTASDYEVIVPRLYPETQSISVYGGETLDPPEFGKIFISIKPYNGTFVPQSIKNNLKVKLRDYSVAGIVVEFIDLKYVYVEADITANYNANLAPDANFVSSIISNNINLYANSTELNRYGAKFKYSKFQKIIDDSHQSLGDFPNADNQTGTIFLFATINGTDSIIAKRSVGTIDYVKGEINLSPINILSTAKKVNQKPVIEISAIPLSNDVIGKQDLYLQLDISKVNLKMKLDEIETGYDSSASLYTPSTSYTNGSLIRK